MTTEQGTAAVDAQAADMTGKLPPGQDYSAVLLDFLGDRLIVLVGMMASGKTSVGRILAQKLSIPFVDADQEIETAAQMTVPEIFSKHGEADFRSGERRVIARILREGPRVLATGGGAYMSEETRELIRERGLSIWLKADAETILRRAKRRSNRPLLQNDDPEGTIRKLIDLRYPIYGQADITVQSRDGTHDETVANVIDAVIAHITEAKKT